MARCALARAHTGSGGLSGLPVPLGCPTAPAPAPPHSLLSGPCTGPFGALLLPFTQFSTQTPPAESAGPDLGQGGLQSLLLLATLRGCVWQL